MGMASYVAGAWEGLAAFLVVWGLGEVCWVVGRSLWGLVKVSGCSSQGLSLPQGVG